MQLGTLFYITVLLIRMTMGSINAQEQRNDGVYVCVGDTRQLFLVLQSV